VLKELQGEQAMKSRRPDQLTLVAGWCAYLSGVVSIVGIVFLVIMYIGFFTNDLGLQRFGPLNDVCIIIQYLLALPVALALHQLLKSRAPNLSRTALLIGIAGMIGVMVLQGLLVAGVVTFEEQVGAVMVALLVVGAWLVITGYLGRSTGKLPRGLRMSILAAFYLGYPIWAFWLGRKLLSRRSTFAERSASLRGEMA
jgi:hypothetical protein